MQVVRFKVGQMIEFYCLHHLHNILGDVQDAMFVEISMFETKVLCSRQWNPFYTSVGSTLDCMYKQGKYKILEMKAYKNMGCLQVREL